MQNKTEERTTEVVAEETGTTETQPVVVEETKEDEGLDVKAEAQKMADAMVAKKMKGMPTKEELKEYKDYKDSLKTNEEKIKEEALEKQKMVDENTNLKRVVELFRLGVNQEDMDYVLFKCSQIDGDFDNNLSLFLKENPKYLTSNQDTEKVSTGVSTKREAINEVMGFENILKDRNPDLKI